MVDRNHEADETKESNGVLGDDPFESADIEWLNREEGELSIKVLGQDPLEDMDLDWLHQAVDQGDEQPPALDQEHVEIVLTEMAKPVPGMSIFDMSEGVGGFDSEPVVVERSPLGTLSMLELDRLEPRVLEPTRSARHVGGGAAEPGISRPQATFHFPADFRWGVTTSAHQVEGENIYNDWWAWEQESGHIKDGRTSGAACDWWENAEADFDWAAHMGLNSLRLSVEWSRVEPRSGVFDDSALEQYGEMLQALRGRNIEPMVTLHHFSSPRWLAEQGGWEAPETIARFTRFVRRVVEALGEYCDLWCTINEPGVYGVMGYMDGVFPPGRSDSKMALRVIRNLLAGHAVAYREIHALQPDARVGLAHHMRAFDPVNSRSSLDRRATRALDRMFNQAILTALIKGRWMLPLGFGPAWKLRRTLDWIGLNYYTRDMVAFDRTQSQSRFGSRRHADGAELLDGGYGEFYPQGMFRCLKRLAHLGLPIYITENGIPDDDDDQRPRYLLTHLHQVWHAIQLCYPVMGYYHRTLVDSFEWAEGWALRFGLISLDTKGQVRRPRRSAGLYADVIRANAITPQIIDTYAPSLRPELLPG